MKTIVTGQFWKRSLGMGLSIAMGLTLLPAFPAEAADYPESVPVLSEELKSIPVATKAGSIPASEETLTYEQPFAPFMAGCENFRIPTLISLKNGEHKGDIFVSADARWEEWNDGGGTDSIASVSSDGGRTWNYSFPIYFPDSYGYASSAATTIIDPGVIEGPDGTLYFIADVNPTGSTTMYGTVPQGTGYVTIDGERYLALTDNYSNVKTKPTDDNLTVYPYYVEKFNDEGYARILKRSDGGETGYGVDEWFNIYEIENGEYKDTLTQAQVNNADVEIQQNCYYKDSMFHVFHIDYLWVVQSTDGGRTWEHPRDITDQVKLEDDNALLVSPGKGIATKDGEIAIGVYSAQGSKGERASMIYSKDGENWERTNAIIADDSGDAISYETSSEDEIVQLKDGTLRMFYRGGGNVIRYADITKDENGKYTMGKFVSTQVSVKSSINVTAVLYSKEINGKQAIIVARSGGGGGLTSDSRLNGKIFTFLVDDTQEGNPMTLYNTFDVPGGKDGFVYSCMDELEDGRLAILWEPNHSTLYFDIFDIMDLVPETTLLEGVSVNVELEKDGSPYIRNYFADGDPVVDETGDTAVAEMTIDSKKQTFILRDHISNSNSSLDSFSETVNPDIALEEAEFTFTDGGEENIWEIYNESAKKYLTNNDSAGTFFSSDLVNKMKVTPVSEDDGTKTFKICKETGSRFIIFYPANMDFNSNAGDTGNTKMVLLEKKEAAEEGDIVPGYAHADSITSGNQYLIAYVWTDGSVFVLYPTNGTAAQTKLVGSTDQMRYGSKAMIQIEPKGAGATQIVVDSVTYQVTVADPDIISIEKGKTYFIPSDSIDLAPESESGRIKAVALGDVDGLADHISDCAFSTYGFAAEAAQGSTLADAEFTFTAAGTNWNISHEDIYFSNPENAMALFSDTAAAIYVEKNTDENTFRISRGEALKNTSGGNITTDKSPWSPIGNLVFFYREMGFRSYGTRVKDLYTHGANPYGQHADYNLILLKKQETVSEDDILPGYQIAESVEDGGVYLISYIWEDGSVFVLYPKNGLANSVKLAKRGETGFLITAERAGYDSISIDGTPYMFKVTSEDYTQEKEELDEIFKQAEQIYKLNETGLPSWEAFEEAYQAVVNAQGVTDAAELNRLKEQLQAITKTLEQEIEIKEGEDAKNDLQAGINAVKTVRDTEESKYTPESWKLFIDAYNNAVNAPADADAAALRQLLSDLQTAKDGLKPAEAGQPSNGDGQPSNGDGQQSAGTGQPSNDDPGQTIQKGYEESIKGITYRVTDTSQKTVTAAGASVATVSIPQSVSIGGTSYQVTAIDAKAFRNSKSLKKLTIGTGITSIPAQAFSGCTKLTTVIIGKNVKTIGKKAFYNCKKLNKVTVKASSKLNKVGTGAFKNTSKKISLTLPKNLKKNKKIKNQIQKAGIKKVK